MSSSYRKYNMGSEQLKMTIEGLKKQLTSAANLVINSPIQNNMDDSFMSNGNMSSFIGNDNNMTIFSEASQQYLTTQVNQLNEEKQTLELENGSLELERTKLSEKVNSLNKRIDSIEKTRKREKRNFEEDYNELNQTIQNHMKTISDQKDEISRVRDQLRTRDKKIPALEHENNHFKQERDKYKRRVASLQTNINELHENLAGEKNLCVQYQKQINTIQNEHDKQIQHYETTLQQYRNDCEEKLKNAQLLIDEQENNHQQQFSSVESQVSDMTEKVSVLHQQLQHTLQQNKELKAQLTNTAQQHALEMQKHETTRSNAEGARRQFDNLNATIVQLQHDKENLKLQIKQLEEQIDEGRSNQSTSIKMLQQTIQQQKLDQKKLRSDMEFAEKELDEQRALVAHLRQLNENYNRESSATDSEYDKKLSNFQRRVNQLEIELENTRLENEKRVAQYQDLERSVDHYKQEIRNKEETIKLMESTETSLSSAKDEYYNKLRESERDSAKLEEENHMLRKRIDSLTSKADQMENMLHEHSRDVQHKQRLQDNQLQDDFKQLNREKLQAERARDELQMQIESDRKRMELIQFENKQLRDRAMNAERRSAAQYASPPQQQPPSNTPPTYQPPNSPPKVPSFRPIQPIPPLEELSSIRRRGRNGSATRMKNKNSPSI